jgi:hypothetical protein
MIIINTIGWILLWFIGMFVVPLLAGIIRIYFGGDEDDANIFFWGTFILYWIATAIGLILTK